MSVQFPKLRPADGKGRADVQPQFPQLQNVTNKDAPVNLVQLQGLHVCRLLAHRLRSEGDHYAGARLSISLTAEGTGIHSGNWPVRGGGGWNISF